LPEDARGNLAAPLLACMIEQRLCFCKRVF